MPYANPEIQRQRQRALMRKKRGSNATDDSVWLTRLRWLYSEFIRAQRKDSEYRTLALPFSEFPAIDPVLFASVQLAESRLDAHASQHPDLAQEFYARAEIAGDLASFARRVAHHPPRPPTAPPAVAVPDSSPLRSAAETATARRVAAYAEYEQALALLDTGGHISAKEATRIQMTWQRAIRADDRAHAKLRRIAAKSVPDDHQAKLQAWREENDAIESTRADLERREQALPDPPRAPLHEPRAQRNATTAQRKARNAPRPLTPETLAALSCVYAAEPHPAWHLTRISTGRPVRGAVIRYHRTPPTATRELLLALAPQAATGDDLA